MPVLRDPIDNADAVLSEAMSLMQFADTLDQATLPMSELVKKSPVKKSVPVLISDAGKVLKGADVENFEAEFPSLATATANGALGDFSYRINDAMYRVGEVVLAARKAKYMLVKDEQRKELNTMAKAACGDVAIYLINTFSLWDTGDSYMAIMNLCERNGYSPDVLYGMMLDAMKRTDSRCRAYEPMSPVYTELLAAEPALMSECMDRDLPLGDEDALKILRGEISASECLEALSKQSIVTAFDEGEEVTPLNMFSRLNLQ